MQFKAYSVARAILCVLALWCASFDASAQFLAPGPLAAPHAQLEGDDRCQECHTVGRGVTNQKCNSCHDAIGKAQASGRGLHGRVFKGQPCFNCHSDHHGKDFQLIRWDPKALNHADTGWPLGGAHATTECKNCHKTKSYLGLGTQCTSCHQDPHDKRFGQACLECHNETSWKTVALTVFDHAKARFPLRGAHQRVECAACHGKPAKYRGLEFSACTSCHKDPHRGQFKTGCEGCHSEDKWSVTSMPPGSHPWLSLGNGHARVACRTCHDKGALRAPSRGRACVSCHPAVHQADFGTQCQSCHANVRWLGLPRPIGLAAHEKTPFPLKGSHTKTPCAGCHSPKLPAKQRFRELEFERCDNCHKDVHAGRFQARNGGECRSCHDESAFRPSHFGPALHATTAFPLSGKHLAVACGACHQQPPGPEQRVNWQSTRKQCADCHQNPHGNQFVAEMRVNGCATCHTPAAWGTPSIKHDTWPLTGVHAQTACDSCHQPSPEDKKLGRGPSYQAAPRECEGCHEDVHRGQFRLAAPERGCSDCHGTQAFKLPTFDHQKSTGHALDGRHAKLVCAECHKPEVLASGKETVRWRLGYRKCSDCHASPHSGASP